MYLSIYLSINLSLSLSLPPSPSPSIHYIYIYILKKKHDANLKYLETSTFDTTMRLAERRPGYWKLDALIHGHMLPGGWTDLLSRLDDIPWRLEGVFPHMWRNNVTHAYLYMRSPKNVHIYSSFLHEIMLHIWCSTSRYISLNSLVLDSMQKC